MTFMIYIGAAVAEIAGCFAFWAWLRLGKSALWLVPGIASLMVFAWLLTLVETSAAGRAYAAYGGVYITTSLIWLWTVEGVRPDRWDMIGVVTCLTGAAIIVLGPRMPV
ncbi:YnfA family protein [Henriciella sp.]|uniref:YnfA family protein n=1 Tax=Henriciella sp. TaxID=1968823 RepID=UPI000C5E96CD|nr:YnfA family protein [Henriciella sp.]MAN73688.1 hypothetical protein [Henriciella sp.]